MWGYVQYYTSLVYMVIGRSDVAADAERHIRHVGGVTLEDRPPNIAVIRELFSHFLIAFTASRLVARADSN